jgi:hypothetical protein
MSNITISYRVKHQNHKRFLIDFVCRCRLTIPPEVSIISEGITFVHSSQLANWWSIT